MIDRKKGRIELPCFPGTASPGAAPALAEPSRDRAVLVPALGAAQGEAPQPAALSQQWGEVAPGRPWLPPSPLGLPLRRGLLIWVGEEAPHATRELVLSVALLLLPS